MLCIRQLCSLCRDCLSFEREQQTEPLHEVYDEEYSARTTRQFDSIMSQRPHSASFSQTASSFATWARRALLGSKESSGEESVPLQAVVLSSEAEPEQGVIEECPICTTSTKNKLASAVPCKHEACERCWQAWLKQQPATSRTCMICAQPMKSVNFPGDARPSKNKGSHFVKSADDALEDALRAMLRIKTELLEITEKIDDTQSHLSFLLQNAQAGVFDSDSATSVVQVEIATTKDQLDRLLSTAAMFPDADRTVSALIRAMRDLDTVVRSYGELSDWSRSTVVTFADVLSPAAKETRTALALQWKTVTDLLRDLFSTRLNVVHGMAMIMPMEGLALISLMDRAKTSIMSAIPAINDKVQTFEAEAKRVMDKIHSAAAQHPTQQQQLESALSSASLHDVKRG